MRSVSKFFFSFLVISISMITARQAFALTTINDCTDLQNINNNLAGDYVLGGDIDCTGGPIASMGTFTGTLDGDNRTIDGLDIDGFTNDHGLFVATNGATIIDLNMANANIEGNYQVGILAATMNNTIVRNVHVQGIIHSNAALSLAGGIAGRFYGTGGTMSFSSADIDITGYEYVAGLAGSVTGGATIEKSYATGTITTFTTGSGSENGGLVGELDSSTIRNSYADVDITAAGNIVGGLVGTNQGSSSISESYSAGAVSSLGVTSIGGLVGQTINTATVTDSYWDTDTSGQTTSDGGTGKTTVEMQQQSIFVDWDFRYIWDIATGEYPTLEAYHEPISSPSAHSAGGRSRAVIMKLRDGVIRVSEKAPTSIFSRSLRLGSHGNDVKKLQEFLNTHGFFVATSGKGSVGNETDIFGPKTQQALIKFQLNHNINPARGFFGPITQGIMAGIL